jgi:lambda family phage tail tape measure protein
MELYKKASEDDVRRLEKEIPFLQKEGLDERINEVAKSVETGFDSMIELSARTAEAMQSNFSDLFFDAMTGELKSFEDYATAIFRSIQRAFADMAGQMLTQQLFGAKSTGAASGGGGWIGAIGGWLGEIFGSGSTAAAANGLAFDRAGVVPFARGGVVNRPTVFPFANGGVGVMGEAGPEAIMPLRRDASGRLGVAAIHPSANITINVAAPQGRMDRESISQMQTALYSTLQRAGRRNA